MHMLDQHFSRDEWQPDMLDDGPQLVHFYLLQLGYTILRSVEVVKSAIAARPAQAGEVELDLFKAVMERVTAEDLSHQVGVYLEQIFALQHIHSMHVNIFESECGYLRQIDILCVLQKFYDKLYLRFVRIYDKSLSGLCKLVLRATNSILIGRVYERHNIVWRGQLHFASINKSNQHSHNVGLNIWNGDFPF